MSARSPGMPESKRPRTERLEEDRKESGGGSGDEAAAATAPINFADLPTTTLGGILDLLLYQDVKSALLINRTAAFDTARYVQTVNVFEPTQLTVRVARRFPNASRVNVLCLVRWNRSIDPRNAACSLSTETATRVVTFLAAFPKLKYAYVGGKRNKFVPAEYSCVRCISPTDHQAIYRHMLQAFCGAFKSKALPQDLILKGLIDGVKNEVWTLTCNRDDADGGRCRLCHDICSSFPLSSVIWLRADSHLGGVCVSSRDRYDMIKSRPGGAKYMRNAVDVMAHYLRNLCTVKIVKSGSKEGDSFVRRMSDSYIAVPDGVLGLHRITISGLEVFVQVSGMDVSKISSKDVQRALIARHQNLFYKHFGSDLGSDGCVLILESTHDRLRTLGFCLDSNDFIVVPDKEPALSDSFYAPDPPRYGVPPPAIRWNPT